MLEYLYNLLENIDRCDITSGELYHYIEENKKILMKLNSKYNRFERNNRFQIGGNKSSTSKYNRFERINRFQIGGDKSSTVDIKEIMKNISEEMRETDKTIESIDGFLKEDDSERNEEVVEIVGMISNYLGELSKMVESKPYSELQEQISNIKGVLEGYVGEYPDKS